MSLGVKSRSGAFAWTAASMPTSSASRWTVSEPWLRQKRRSITATGAVRDGVPQCRCFIEDNLEWLKDSGEWEPRGSIVYGGRCARMTGGGVRHFVVGKTDRTVC